MENLLIGFAVGIVVTLTGVFFIIRNNKAKAADVVNKIK
jgi:hypothetical protein